jgi:hypothetical protein
MSNVTTAQAAVNAAQAAITQARQNGGTASAAQNQALVDAQAQLKAAQDGN